MSRRQRRDHDPVPGAGRDGDTVCMTCDEPLRNVYGPTVTYWRHVRRWQVKPAYLKYRRRPR